MIRQCSGMNAQHTILNQRQVCTLIYVGNRDRRMRRSIALIFDSRRTRWGHFVPAQAQYFLSLTSY